MRQLRDPIHTTDSDGEAIILVPLANHPTPARLFPDDYEALRSRGFSGQWTLNASGTGYSYVRCAHGQSTGRLLTVARIVAGVGKGQRVRYRDDDRLNLRRDNLRVEAGGAFGREAAASAGEPPKVRQRRRAPGRTAQHNLAGAI